METMMELRAGRELDALVAEKVMDLKEVHVGSMTAWHNPAQSGQYPSPDKCNKDSPRESYNEYVYLARPNGEQHSIYRGDTRWGLVPKYSLDIQEAMNIFELYRSLEYDSRLIGFSRWKDIPETPPDGHNWPPLGRGYGCQFAENEYVMWAESFTMAICLAALESVKTKEKTNAST